MTALEPAAAEETSTSAAPAISPALDFAAGTVAGVASLLTGHPFDTVKVRLQTQATPSFQPLANQQNAAAPKERGRQPAPPLAPKGHDKYYRNAVHAFVRISREEGVAGLYKGVTSPMLGVALMNASVFTSYKYTMNLLLSSSPEATEPTLAQITAAGSASGVFTSLITTPIDRLKTLQQSLPSSTSLASSTASTASTVSTASIPSSRTSAPPYSRPLLPPLTTRTATTTTTAQRRHHQPSLATLLRSMSLRSLYRGWSVTILRDLGYGPYFFVYEYVVRGGGVFGAPKRDLKEEIDEELWGHGLRDDDEGGSKAQGEGGASTARILLAGGLAGIVGWGCTFPIDVIKTKIQSVPPSSLLTSPSPHAPSHPYASIASTVAVTWRESGWRGFVAGLGPTLLRSVPVNMVTFAVFELVVSTFR